MLVNNHFSDDFCDGELEVEEYEETKEPPRKKALKRVKSHSVLFSQKSHIICPFLKFLDLHFDDVPQVKFQLAINDDLSDYAEKLGISKSINMKILADSCSCEFHQSKSATIPPQQVSLLASSDIKKGRRKEQKKKSFFTDVMLLFVPKNSDNTDLVSSKARKAQAEQFMLKKRQAQNAQEIAKKTKYLPILRLENGIYTKDEWHCILMHSVISSIDD